MHQPSPIDIDIDLREHYQTPCEYRLLHVPSGKFLAFDPDAGEYVLVDTWEEASWYGSVDHHEWTEEQTVAYQFEFMQEDGNDCLSDFNQAEFRLHVLIGESHL